MKRLTAVIAVLAATLLATSDVRGQESKTPPPEMKILQKIVGAWQDDSTSKVAEWTPEETRAKTTSKANRTLGGRFVLSRVCDSEGKLSSIHLFTYDEEQQVYRQWFFDSNGATVESTGKWDESNSTLSFTNEKQGITGVFSIHFVGEDTMQWSVVSKDQQGKVYLDIHGKTTRQE